MGLLSFLPETSDNQELEDRRLLEEVLQKILSTPNRLQHKETAQSFLEEAGETKAVSLAVNLLRTREAAAAESPVSVAAGAAGLAVEISLVVVCEEVCWLLLSR